MQNQNFSRSRGNRPEVSIDYAWDRRGPRHMNGGFGPHHDHPHDHPHGGPEGGDGSRRQGPFGRGGPRGPGGGRGRAQRGDVRAATLTLLAEEPVQPKHGYQLMQAMAERTNGAWRPSPGAIYPTINQLEDEGLVTTVVDGGRKLVTLTDAGRELVDSGTLADPFADMTAPGNAGNDIRNSLHEMLVAWKQVVRSGNATQINAAVKVLTDARRSLYLILADDAPDASPPAS